MIKSWAFDVEVLPNLFSITFVNLNDYLQKCKCETEVNGKKKVIALTKKYKVSEIKAILDTVECKQFVITDFDDAQLMDIVEFISGMSAKFETSIDGNQVPVRYDLYGYNIIGYDNLMIACFMMYFDQFDKTKDLIRKLYETSQEIIKSQSDDSFYENHELIGYKNYKLPYASVDIMKVFALNKAGVNVDKDTGERKAYPKSLKQTSINLQWYELLEFELPDICDKDRHYYSSPTYKSMTNEELTKLIRPFDRYIIEEYVAPMLHYNKNDVFIVCEAVRQKIDEIRLRYSISSAYHIDVLSSARSNIADKLVTKFYSEMSGLPVNNFIKLRTERTKLSFNKIIFPHIKFKTKQLQDLLEEMKTITITRTNKDAFSREITFYGTTYTIATGGIHSQDPPRILRSTDEYTYRHHDYTSYYPSIIISYKIAPKHLNEAVFVKLVKYLKETRVAAKHGGDVEVVKGIPNKVVAEVLKIVINAIYGKLGSDTYFLYDRLAQMKVTINGQLMTMTLVEELELNGMHVVSANTDGIVVKIPNDKRDLFDEITTRWNEFNKMGADGEDYSMIVSRDINNYLDVQLDGSIEYKGALDPNMYINNLQKGYDMPIVARAVAEYFINDVPVMETLTKCTDILDFCKTQNVGRNFTLEYIRIVNGEQVATNYQRNTRFYVSLHGGVLNKVSPAGARSRLAAGVLVRPINTLTDDPISSRNIDYKYYYNECMKIINPIMLGITPKGKGKSKIKKFGGMYNNLFDLEE
jgi:hypothetical protein